MMKNMMADVNNYAMSMSCGASAACANVQFSCANTAAMRSFNIANILDAIIMASILLIIALLGISAPAIILISVVGAVLQMRSLLACEKVSVSARLLTRAFA